ncbi:MAG: TRAP transporter small permease subunit [Tistlia sp.]|uniref:TRAP transporter small permease subunit n=1 Tax=Tistlia sp. TaxID=3057121 RepID=UPI0034A51181
MPRAIRAYVRGIEALNRLVGRFAMYLIFAMMGILLYAVISRTVFNAPLIWVVEMAQFTMVAYFLLGGPYSLQLDSHVRMDLLYSRWSPRGRAVADAMTAGFLLFYLVFLLAGGVSSTQYALEYGQKNYSSWGPPLAPIKIVMTTGVALMLLQVIAVFFRDLATALGRPIEEGRTARDGGGLP